MPKKLVVIFLISLSAFLTLAAFNPTHAAPPPNFERLELISSGLNNPTGLEFAPDGRLFIVEQGGAVKIYKNGQLNTRFFDELPAFADSDRGLLGIAFDPEYSSNHYVYFYYIDLDSKHKIVRFNASGDIATDGPVDIWSSNEVTGSNHAGGTIQFGPDGKLYASIGEGNFPNKVQSLNNYFGKIIRINKDGTVPSDNPFINTPNAHGEIWALGLRNPFRFQFDPVGGSLLVGDVGGEKFEEVNRIVKGGNYGWPLAEGNCSLCNFINPIYVYPHPTPSYSVTGGLFYNGNLYPQEYKGSYFYGDYAQGFIKRLTFDGGGNVVNSTDFDNSVGSVVDLKTAPDGSIYYVTIFPGKLYKINYSEGNKSPISKISADKTAGSNPLTIQFISTGSTDPDGNQLTYQWDFGDETQSTEPNPLKTYNSAGKFITTLTVSDGKLSTKSAPLEIQVGNPPTVNFTAPLDGKIYNAGETIDYNIVSSGTVAFEILFHHSTHVHPFIRPIKSNSGNFAIPTSGETSADVWYELIATATDANGLTSTKSINIYPQKTKFTLNTNPSGLKVLLDGSPVVTPVTIDAVVGYKREIDATTQSKDGKLWEFDSWSPTGSKKHIITIPETPTTYTATFKESLPFKGQYFNNTNFSGEPVITRDDSVINFSWGNGSPDPKLPNDYFTVRWEKEQFFPAGRYKFSGFSDDGIRAYLNGKLVLESWSFTNNVSSVIDIDEGTYNLRIDYKEEGGGAGVGFSWDLTNEPLTTTPQPSTIPTQTGTPSPTPTANTDVYVAEYFDSQNLQGTPKALSSESKIDFIWNSSGPNGVPNDQFSARWTKSVNLEEGIYQFELEADDGVRLYLDDELILDQWHDQSRTYYYIDKKLQAGTHTIKLEYYEAFGGAVARFNYKKLPNDFLAEYFDNQHLSGNPTVVGFDSKINFVLNHGKIHADIPSNHFSSRWTKKQYFGQNKNYSFTIKSDDGVRFWVNDKLVIDDWTDHGMKTYTPTINLTEGIHSLKIEYYENFGSSVIILNQNN